MPGPQANPKDGPSKTPPLHPAPAAAAGSAATPVSRSGPTSRGDHSAAAAARSDLPRSSSALLLHRLSRPRIIDRADHAHGWPTPPRRRPTARHSDLSDPSMRKRERPQQPSEPASDDENPNADLSLEDAVLENADGAARDVEAGHDRLADVDRIRTTLASRLQEVAFLLADSTMAVGLTFLLIVVDAAFFLAFLVYILVGDVPPRFQTAYSVMDILTAVTYFCEVSFRLFSYGFWYYCHSLLRVLDYTVSVSNAVVVLSSLTYARRTKWLLIIRYLRLVRALTVTTMTRERFLRAQTRAELQDLADLLDQERSDQSRLVKWRIDPDAIALGEAAGKGMFGAVFLGLFRGTLVAVKQLYQSNDAAQEYTTIEDEAVTLVNLRHPNVVLFMGFVHEPDKLWIVTEYCSRGSIRDLLDKPDFHLTQSRILKLALGAARGLAYLHGQDPPVLHLDLKTSNILISSGWDAKLADFGLSRNVDNIQNNTFAGTIQYSAPEILESNLFGTAADVYSFGICLWEMAARETPFKDCSPMDVLWTVVKQNRRPSLDGIRARSDGTEMLKMPCANVHLTNVESFSEAPSPSSFDPASTPSAAALETDLVAFLQNRQVLRHSEPPRTTRHTELDSRRPFSKSALDPTSNFLVANTRPRMPRGVEVPLSPAETPKSLVESHQVGLDPMPGGARLASNTQVIEPDRIVTRRSPFSPRRSTGNLGGRGVIDADDVPATTVVLDYAAAKLEMTTRPQVMLPTATTEGQSEWSSLLSAKIQMYDDRPLVAKRTPIPSSIPSIATSKMMETLRLKRRSVETGSSEADPGDADGASSIAGHGLEKKLTSATTFQQRLESLSNLAGRPSVIPVLEDADHQLAVEDECLPSTAEQTRGEREQLLPPNSEEFGSIRMSKEYVELIENCWAQSPGDRPSADEVVWRLVGLIDEHIRRSNDRNLGVADWHE
jgi:serine/threonine protein kinase